MAVDLIDATTIRPKQCSNKHFPGSPIAFYSEARYLIIRLPNSKFIKICFRFLLLILALASFQFMLRSSSSSSSLFNEIISPTSTHQQQKSVSESIDDSNSYSMDTEHVLSILFRDLTNEGLVKKTQQKAVFLCNEDEKPSNVAVNDYNMEHVPLNDLEKQNSVLDNSVDFIYTSNYPAASKFIERVLKTEGIATVLINDNDNNPSVSAPFYKPSNYKITYMRRFDSIAVAMKKTGGAVEPTLAAPRKLCSYASEAKKAALQKLEDVLLEPPRAVSGKSRKYLKRTRYLPDLMGDSLESYPRRVFIDIGLPEKDGGSGTEWFSKNYPTRNKNFEMYKILIEMVGAGEESSVAQIGMLDWLRKNVKEEEYVVMKAEAEVVEEIMRSNSMGLVDELFLECKPKQRNRRSRRAYWECLALYGKLRDEGVAVHQWWG